MLIVRTQRFITHWLIRLCIRQLVALQKKGQIRRLLIGFGRESVVNTAIRYSNFGPCLEIITMLYNKLPYDKFDITTTLVENFNSEVKEKGSIHHLPNNFSK